MTQRSKWSHRGIPPCGLRLHESDPEANQRPSRILSEMKISVLGLGYVGTVSAGCLAKDGHEVIGVDPEWLKIDLLNLGKTPLSEKDIGQIIAEQVAAGRLAATLDLETAVRHTD